MPEQPKQFAPTHDASRSQRRERSASRRECKESDKNRTRWYVFREIPTQLLRFRVPAEADGNMPVNDVAEMLAMHCLALNRRLEDFEVSVFSQSSLPLIVTELATQLIASGRSAGATKLTLQQQKVLDGVAQRLSNKEIASRLGISVRTVKFHISSLFAKFQVSSRSALGWQAAAGQRSQATTPDSTKSTNCVSPPAEVKRGMRARFDLGFPQVDECTT